MNKYINKYINKRVAKRLLLTGGLLWLLTRIVALIVLWNIYGLAGSSFEAGNTAASGTDGLTVWSIIAKVNLFIEIGAYVLLGLGIANLIISNNKFRHK